MRLCILFALLPLLLGGETACDNIPPFPREAVYSAFQTYKVPRHLWTNLLIALDATEREVNETAKKYIIAEEQKQKTGDLPPLLIASLRRKALYEEYSRVMQEVGGITNERAIFEIFDEIESEKARLIWECYEGTPENEDA